MVRLSYIFLWLLLAIFKTDAKQDFANRIVGGNPVTQGSKYPWFVLSASGNICGGSLIRWNVVLTAAHCLESESSWVDAYVGAIDRQGRPQLGSTSSKAKVPIIDKIVHPLYVNDTSGQEYDFALLRLGGFGGVSTVELDDGNVAVGTDATVMGLGFTSGEEGSSTPSLISDVTIPIQDGSLCTFGRYNDETMVCAGEPSQTKGACKADSGGPLVVEGTNIQVGVTSFGSGDCRGVSVYARVSAARDWIFERTCEWSADEKFCENSPTSTTPASVPTPPTSPTFGGGGTTTAPVTMPTFGGGGATTSPTGTPMTPPSFGGGGDSGGATSLPTAMPISIASPDPSPLPTVTPTNAPTKPEVTAVPSTRSPTPFPTVIPTTAPLPPTAPPIVTSSPTTKAPETSAPSLSPITSTLSPVPRIPVNITLAVQLDGFPQEVSVQIEQNNDGSVVIALPPSGTPFSHWNQTVEVFYGVTYKLLLEDSGGDGLESGSFRGWVQIFQGNDLVLQVDGDFGAESIQTFTLLSNGESGTSLNPFPIFTATPDLDPTSAEEPEEGKAFLQIDFQYDDRPWETKWIVSRHGVTKLVGPSHRPSPGEVGTYNIQNLAPGDYEMTLYDEYGDGMQSSDAAVIITQNLNGNTISLLQADGIFDYRKVYRFTVQSN